MARARYAYNPDYPKGFVSIFCPGCNCEHHLSVLPMDRGRPVWSWNSDLNRPTFSPSLLVRSGKYVEGEAYKKRIPPDLWGSYEKSSYLCHSFIKDGKIQYLHDCTHSLKGQTVDLPEFPEEKK